MKLLTENKKKKVKIIIIKDYHRLCDLKIVFGTSYNCHIKSIYKNNNYIERNL